MWITCYKILLICCKWTAHSALNTWAATQTCEHDQFQIIHFSSQATYSYNRNQKEILPLRNLSDLMKDAINSTLQVIK